MSEAKKSIFSKEISIGKKGGKNKYPEKTYINLVQDENKGKNTKALIYFGIYLIALAIFVKFAVLDQLSKVNVAEAQYNRLLNQVTEMKQKNTEYASVKAQYDEVTDWYMTEEEKLEVDKTNVFKMLEDDMMPYVGISSVQVSGKTIVVQTNVTDLQTVSAFLSKLQTDPRNGYVTVTTAAAKKQGKEEPSKNDVTATVVITYGGSEGGN